jgi:hypothetical protein
LRAALFECISLRSPVRLLNNFDRTPAIWDHEGNANNLLFCGEHLVAIDNATTGILNEDGAGLGRAPCCCSSSSANVDAGCWLRPGLRRYLDRVREALQEAKAKRTDGPCVSKVLRRLSCQGQVLTAVHRQVGAQVRRFLNVWTQHDIGEAGCAAFQVRAQRINGRLLALAGRRTLLLDRRLVSLTARLVSLPSETWANCGRCAGPGCKGVLQAQRGPDAGRALGHPQRTFAAFAGAEWQGGVDAINLDFIQRVRDAMAALVV